MSLALVLIVLGGAVVLAVVLIVAIPWIKETIGGGVGRPPPDRPTFRVVTLGLEGSGKTVLLASMFHQLSTPTADRRYFLDGNFAQDRYLTSLFGDVSDPARPWPPGSKVGDPRELRFDCNALDKSGDAHTIFHLSYLDYAGDIIEPGEDYDQAVRELEANAEDAHALLVLVDGRRVLQLLRGEPGGHDYFDRRLRPLLGLAARTSCPIQLILTKWDLVRLFGEPTDDDEARLRRVRSCLAAYGSIEHLVHGHGRGQRQVRLIPVSAVGPDFAELRDDGTVAKRPDGRVDPTHVEVPLYAVLPDVLRRIATSLERAPEIRKALDAELRRSRLRKVPSVVHSVLMSPAGKLLRTALTGVVGEEAVKLFVEMLVRTRPDGAVPPPSRVDPASATDTEALRAAVIDHMERAVVLFEARLPSSTLRTTWL
jgi:hypothetical protein